LNEKHDHGKRRKKLKMRNKMLIGKAKGGKKNAGSTM
jgi:hypothetical protein